MEIRIDGDCAKAHHHPSELAEGAPGLLHGGYAAWLVDCMCGLLVEEKGGSAPRTASLTLNYRAPTPIGSELLLRSAIEQREGRKLWVTATIEAEGVVTVEARGLFITRQD
ncbi:PaaI family thioesterase [Dietzia psychralcaliphila]|uniref:PaaI family thioesterase n=1 Tax=Dietzia psychralcaliphila TaxID=139021 RepID=UPI0027E0BFA1|nr:PaaI family thioesterase [Dietzia psychralcaliphila]